MDLNLSEASYLHKVEQYLATLPDKKNLSKKSSRVPQIPYVPPHRRDPYNTNNTSIKLNEMHNNNNSYSIELQKPTITSPTNVLINKRAFRTTLTLPRTASADEIHSSKLDIKVSQKECFKDEERNVKQLIANKDDKSENEDSSEQYLSASDLNSESVILSNKKKEEDTLQTLPIKEGTFHSAQSPSEIKKCDEKINLSVSMCNGIKKDNFDSSIKSVAQDVEIKIPDEKSNLSVSMCDGIKKDNFDSSITPVAQDVEIKIPDEKSNLSVSMCDGIKKDHFDSSIKPVVQDVEIKIPDEKSNLSINISNDIKKDTFDSSIKLATQDPQVFQIHDEEDNLSIGKSNSIENAKITDEKQDERSLYQSISVSNCERKEEVKIDNATILQRILDLANTYVNVTFKTMLHDLYCKQYNESIPLNILQELSFLVEIDDKLLKCQYNITSTKKKVVNNEPKLLNAKDIGNKFFVQIYNCKSNSKDIEIWGKIMKSDNVKKLDRLREEMTIYYSSEKVVAPYIQEGGFYAVFKDYFWHRVKCLKRNAIDAVILFIDRGDEFIVPLVNIYELHNKFTVLSAQAIKMKLPDLEVFADCCETLQFLKETLKERTLFATSINSPNQDENMYWNVQLYLNIYDEKINIADLVIEHLLKTSLNPKFDIQKEEIIPVHVSCLRENKVFIQLIESRSYKYYMKLFRNIIKNYLNYGYLKQPELNLNEDKIYLIQNPKSKVWYRSKILKFKNEKEVETLLIDFGTKVCISKENFILLEKFSSIFTKYPKQAIEVRIDEISNFLEYQTLDNFQKLIHCTSTFFASFVESTLENNIPVIKLFKKELDNSLTAITDTLLHKRFQIRNSNIVSVAKWKSSNDINITHQSQRMLKMREMQRSLSLTSLSAVLDPPQISKNSCDVHVVLADHPLKFVIQLLSSKFELKELDNKISHACNSYKGPRLDIMSLRIGQLYAAKYDEYDNKWYRVYLIKVSEIEKTVSIYYCDYGYYKDTHVENIVPLETQFHQLPYQAIWAELYGIKPVFDTWTVDDASRFKDLTQLKNFVCTVRRKTSFKPTNNEVLIPVTVETVYSLELIDTSTEEDIYIADILVKERRALKSKYCANQDQD